MRSFYVLDRKNDRVPPFAASVYIGSPKNMTSVVEACRIGENVVAHTRQSTNRAEHTGYTAQRARDAADITTEAERTRLDEKLQTHNGNARWRIQKEKKNILNDGHHAPNTKTPETHDDTPSQLPSRTHEQNDVPHVGVRHARIARHDRRHRGDFPREPRLLQQLALSSYGRVLASIH